MITLQPTYTLSQLQSLTSNSAYYSALGDVDMQIRIKAIRQEGEAQGMQRGLVAESHVIDKMLDLHAGQLDSIFNFGLVLYKNNILPPVIVKATNALNVAGNGQTLRIGGQIYNIIQQVKFVPTPPTWRNYVWMSYQNPPPPAQVLLPRNQQEAQVWAQAVAYGWKEGVEQAVLMYKINLNRLVQDYDGMLLYKELLTKQMISPYTMVKAYHGVTGTGSHMVVDDQVWKIVTQPQLQIHSKFWRPVVIQNHNKTGGGKNGKQAA